MRESLRLLDESIKGVLSALPNNDDVAQWAREYADNHLYRLAHDLELVRRYAPRGARILEFGSSPCFLTIALQRAGYEVCGLDIGRLENQCNDQAIATKGASHIHS